MVAVILGFLLTLALSVGVLLLVAMPHLKRGSRILTPDGERAVRHAQEQSRVVASAVQRGVVAAPNAVADMIRHTPEQRDSRGETSADGRTAAVEDAPEPVAEGISAGEDAPEAAAELVSESVSESVPEPEGEPVPAAASEREPVIPVVPVVQPLPVITAVPPEPEPDVRPAPTPEAKPEPTPVAGVQAKPEPKPKPESQLERGPEPEPKAPPAARPSVGRQRPSPAISGPIRQPEGDGKLVKPPIKPSNKRHKTKTKSRRR